MEERPPDKRLQVAPFAVHATRGMLRDERTRRGTIAVLIFVSIAMVVVGLLVRKWLEPREHPGRFLLFWGACGWITLTALLLGLLDLLLVRRQARQARRALLEGATENATVNPPKN